MLSVKTNLASTASHHHHHHQGSSSSSFHRTGGPPSLALPATMTASDAVDQAMTVATSCCSLMDSMSTGASTASSSATNGTSHKEEDEAPHNSNGVDHTAIPASRMLKKKPSMKSSYALTSMLQQHVEQQQQEEDEENTQQQQQPRPQEEAFFPETTTMSPAEFGTCLHTALDSQHPERPFPESKLRKALEIPLRQARKRRDICRQQHHQQHSQAGPSSPTSHPSNMPLTSWVGLPYTALREERPFLYDHMHTHPLAEILCQTLGVSDLHDLHQGWNASTSSTMSAKQHQRQLFAPLLDRRQRQRFQQAYESFVTSCCIPLLHAAALRQNVFSTGAAGVVYRYQVFPTLTVVYPNDKEACQPPSCDLNKGHSVGWLHFHVPLTASVGTSALYCERYPGREDWHPLRCTSVGLGYCWDAARCLSFTPLNTTGKTRVSLDFRILLVRPGDQSDSNALCQPHHLVDNLTGTPGFYEEATMDDGMAASRIVVMRRQRRRRSSSSSSSSSSNLSTGDPDARCGFPFA